MNKKGNLLGILIFIVIAFLIMFVGVLMAFGSVVLNWTMDEVAPELSNLGVIGDANFTKIADYTITPLNSIVQNFTWLTGVLYFMMLIGLVGFAVTMRLNPNRWLIGFFLLLMIVLVLGSIFISNIYEDFYTGTDDVATRLQEHTILSFMILYSPMIFTILGFVFGLIIFSGMQEEFI